MSVNYESWIWRRYYQVPPDKKTIEDCRSHGNDHAAYKWSPQIDPRWSDEQKAAYIEGYEKEELTPACSE